MKRNGEKWWREMEKKNQGLTKNVKRNDEEKWRKKSGFNEECEEKRWREMEKQKSGFNEECEEKWWREMEKKIRV